jgi:hypothetical protein
MSFMKRPRATSPAESVNPDILAIESMRREGADPDIPHITRHFLYIPGVKSAHKVARELKAPHRDVEIDTSARKGFWLVVVQQSMLVTPESMAAMRMELDLAARSVGGDYDRWQVEVAGG